MKLYALNTGYLETDKNTVVACATIGTRQNPHISNEWIKLPVMAYLIETKDGYIVYDTGSNPEAMKVQKGMRQKAELSTHGVSQDKKLLSAGSEAGVGFSLRKSV